MQIIHHMCADFDTRGRQLLARAKAQIISADNPEPQVVFRIAEDNQYWDAIRQYLSDQKPLDLVSTKFSVKELSQARSLRILSDWHHGYPMPDRGFGYLNHSYDLGQHCKNCGIGTEQDRPFRFRGEPRWGKRHILQKHWVYDTFFVLPDVYERCFRPLSIPSWPVVDHRSGKELTTVVQLKPDTILKPSERIPQLFHAVPCTNCGEDADCGRTKYRGTGRGMFPYVELPQGCHMALTAEWLGGDGGAAGRGVIVSAEFYRVFTENNLKGARFEPVEDVPGH